MADGSVSMPRGQDDSFRGAHLRSKARLRFDKQPSPSLQDVAKELAGLEPFTEESARAKREKGKLEFLRRMERYRKENQVALQIELKARLLDFDPKQGGQYYNRFYHTNLAKFDLDEESPLGPMRFTNAVYKDRSDYELCEGINIFAVKISCCDVGFPIHVYGTVIARDDLDKKCVYLFRRDRDHCQTINSKDESLVLTGPKRGLALLDYVYIETDLKIKDDQGNDKEFSKGLLYIRGLGPLQKCEAESKSLATRLSTVDVIYGYVSYAVEGTIAIDVRKGYFDGEITAHTTSIQDKIVLYDREMYGLMVSGGRGVIPLVRPVVCVSVKDMLVIVVKTRDGKFERKISFTPDVNKGDEDVISVGPFQMCVKVTWSIMDF